MKNNASVILILIDLMINTRIGHFQCSLLCYVIKLCHLESLKLNWYSPCWYGGFMDRMNKIEIVGWGVLRSP